MRPGFCHTFCVYLQFQSTHPVRGATIHGIAKCLRIIISIHAPREGCDDIAKLLRDKIAISIHAPREGCDSICPPTIIRFMTFQSTHPVRGATRGPNGDLCDRLISIHAPREGCDGFVVIIKQRHVNFNPRTP